MQSKPLPLPSLGIDSHIDDCPENLTLSGNNVDTTNTLQSQTDILFKVKNAADMKRIFGLLQWKNSLIYDDAVSFNVQKLS